LLSYIKILFNLFLLGVLFRKNITCSMKLPFQYKKKIIKSIFIFFFLSAFFISACNNPFAPKLSDNKGTQPTLGDQRTFEGIFQNFRYAYMYKDTVVYSNLLADDFIFVYYNYEGGESIKIPKSWGREEDMTATARLFQSASDFNLIWNEVITSQGTSIKSVIKRGFDLTITFPPVDRLSFHGSAEFTVVRPDSLSIWKISQWVDLTEY